MMNVLSLFDGMSCGQIALERAGITVDKYFASEIDKYAIQVAKHNYPNTQHLGDVANWREWAIDWANIDLLCGGSPCQGFSVAGKHLAFDDPRSKLFFIYVDILTHIKAVNPSVQFLLENVKMRKDHLAVISEQLGVEPVFINSSLVSAQNRQRYYWANWEFEQPEDEGIRLKDILEYGVVDRNKAYCIDANYWKGGNPKNYFEKHRRQLVFSANTATVSKDTGVNLVYDLENLGFERAPYIEPFEMNRAVNYKKEKFKCLRAEAGGRTRGKGICNDDGWWRKLTPVECERLQTVPDNYTAQASNTQRYRMLGNGWTVDVIAHIFKGLL